MKLKWEEQQILFQVDPAARRYHPHFIGFCLSIQEKGSSAYDEISDMLILPSQSCLRNNKHAFAPKPGLNADDISRMEKATGTLSGVEKYVGIVFDEMKESVGLLFKKSTGDVVEYVDLGDPLSDFIAYSETNNVATHALVNRGVCSSLKSVISYYQLDHLA